MASRRSCEGKNGASVAVVADPKHEYTRLLIASQPGRWAPAAPRTTSSSAPALLRVRELVVSFPRPTRIGELFSRGDRSFRAVDNVTFEVRAGESFAIVGESGSGKSTIARAIIGLVRPSGGTLQCNGQDVTALSGDALRRFRRSVQMIFQSPYDSLNPRLPIGETIAEPMIRHGLFKPAAARHKAAELLEMVELSPDLAHRRPHAIAFETGLSIADRVGVSEMSVIRFIRSLGYRNLRDLKNATRGKISGDHPDVDNAMERFQVHHDGLAESLKLELKAVVKAYELTGTKEWAGAVDLLATRRTVFVCGFQASKGLALDFANRLKYARPGVHFAEGTAGTFSEVLQAPAKESCLVLFDTIAYARKSMMLARKAQEKKLPIVIVTDMFSHWAHDFTDLVLEGHTYVKTFWDSSASISVIVNLLINSVATKLGRKAEDNFREMVEYGDYFEEFEKVRETLKRGRVKKVTGDR
ncbi:ATP-binding cassette domain-containing protein [Dongia rigui]|uniref:ATP-binding cassette domain-containing protein n=1 Tax=Dongia rigui TaxID=940149 RepID=A0ABU5DUV1_9PROT|nr:ATP-binding cassette domain-containing protein [Dongia rigui]MDY0870742.1 ATP-binding cassette domain-containing protein [Dongia rigui]